MQGMNYIESEGLDTVGTMQTITKKGPISRYYSWQPVVRVGGRSSQVILSPTRPTISNFVKYLISEGNSETSLKPSANCV